MVSDRNGMCSLASRATSPEADQLCSHYVSQWLAESPLHQCLPDICKENRPQGSRLHCGTSLQRAPGHATRTRSRPNRWQQRRKETHSLTQPVKWHLVDRSGRHSIWIFHFCLLSSSGLRYSNRSAPAMSSTTRARTFTSGVATGSADKATVYQCPIDTMRWDAVMSKITLPPMPATPPLPIATQLLAWIQYV